MPSQSHIKRKERLALALRIETLGRQAKPCSYCTKHSRKCLLSLSLSTRCSECVRFKRACDSKGYHEPMIFKRVCRFFIGPRPKRLLTPPPDPVADPSTSWLPAFDLDEVMADPSFWEALDSAGGTALPWQGSS